MNGAIHYQSERVVLNETILITRILAHAGFSQQKQLAADLAVEATYAHAAEHGAVNSARSLPRSSTRKARIPRQSQTERQLSFIGRNDESR